MRGQQTQTRSLKAETLLRSILPVSHQITRWPALQSFCSPLDWLLRSSGTGKSGSSLVESRNLRSYCRGRLLEAGTSCSRLDSIPCSCTCHDGTTIGSSAGSRSLNAVAPADLVWQWDQRKPGINCLTSNTFGSSTSGASPHSGRHALMHTKRRLQNFLSTECTENIAVYSKGIRLLGCVETVAATVKPGRSTTCACAAPSSFT